MNVRLLKHYKSKSTISHQKNDYPGHAQEQIYKQLQDIEKYIHMFEKLQDKRKTGQLDNQTKHVLDPIWN